MMQHTLVWRKLEYHHPGHQRRYAAHFTLSQQLKASRAAIADLRSRLNTVRIGL